mmetsp:Transcript_65863/g.196002  ORF Transcript_65863/g.196002 Transcript_65863/m.196002 type:complete len:205 (-) Transcript_65863:407-1021(-)
MEGPVHVSRHMQWGGGGRTYGYAGGVDSPLLCAALEALLRAGPTGAVLRGLAMLLRRAGHDRDRDHLDRRPGRDAGLRARDLELRHRHHLRRPRDLPTGHLRLEAGRGAGHLRRRQRGQRDRQQLRERLPGPGAALDDRRHLLGRLGRPAWQRMAREVPRGGQEIPGGRLHSQGRRPRPQRRSLLRLQRPLPPDPGCPAEVPGC